MCQQRESNILEIEINTLTKGNWLINQAIIEKQFFYSEVIKIRATQIKQAMCEKIKHVYYTIQI